MLSELLGSRTRAHVLRVLFTPPRSSVHLRQLVRETGGSVSGVQRELQRLEDLGLVRSQRTPDGRRSVELVEGSELIEPLRRLVDIETTDAATGRCRGARTVMSPPAELLNPRVRAHLPEIIDACRKAGAERVVVFGSGARADPTVIPRDLDLMIRLGGPLRGRAARYFALRDELQDRLGLSVDLVEEEALQNPHLKRQVDDTGVEIVATA